MKTTLNKIKSNRPCSEGWENLLTFLNKIKADDEELDLLTILESNGLIDALWALKCVEGFDREIRLMACDFAESVIHLANDERCVNAIKISRDYTNGLATQEELNVANDAAWAARDAASYDARNAASYASYAAARAAWAASYDARNAARYTANYASSAAWEAAKNSEVQIEIFKKYCK